MLPESKHLIGKLYMQRIKRESLTLSIHLNRLNKKTIEYLRPTNIRNKIINTFLSINITLKSQSTY
ncbi:IS1 family transposase [Candidatus Enterovibrio altilux]|uniref:IS1 family transposase n=2 Tax=Candidatus Enterovibrio altilux TaxID=1927128 RepID=UPI001CC23317